MLSCHSRVQSVHPLCFILNSCQRCWVWYKPGGALACGCHKLLKHDAQCPDVMWCARWSCTAAVMKPEQLWGSIQGSVVAIEALLCNTQSQALVSCKGPLLTPRHAGGALTGLISLSRMLTVSWHHASQAEAPAYGVCTIAEESVR